jgi:mannitol/fructose-specific phosphotransferase system IIA component
MINKINNILRTISIDDKNCDLIVSQYVSGVKVQDNEISLVINITQENQKHIEEIQKKIRESLIQIPVITKVNIVLTGEQSYTKPNNAKQKRRRVWRRSLSQ